MNKRAQWGFIFFIVIFVIIFMFGLATYFGVVSDVIGESNPTGIVGLVFGNLPFTIITVFLIVMFFKMGAG